MVGKDFEAFPSHLKRRRSPRERREELQGRATFPESPRCLRPFQGHLFSLHCLDFQAEVRLSLFPSHLKRKHSPQERREELQGRATIPIVPEKSQSIPGKTVFPALPLLSSRGSTHNTMARGTALWKRLVEKPRGKASRESPLSLDPREGKRDTAATAREESARECPHSRPGLTPPGRLQKYPKIHVSTGEESSSSVTDSTQGLRILHRRERNPESPPSNSHGHWPFLRLRERVPEVPVVSREHLPQLEKIQEVLPSRRDEAYFR